MKKVVIRTKGGALCPIVIPRSARGRIRPSANKPGDDNGKGYHKEGFEMRFIERLFFGIVCFGWVSMLWTPKALAYIDPGSGSYLLQLMMAAALGGAFAIKVFSGKIKIFLSNLFSKKKKKDHES